MFIVGPGIVAASILNHLADGATATWHIPDATSDFVEEDRGCLRGYGGAVVRWCEITNSYRSILVPPCPRAPVPPIPQGTIAAIDDGEETVGTGLAAKEHAIEAQPLGTGQGRRLHILGTLDDGNADLFQAAIAPAVLKGREEQGIRTLVDDLLHHRTHAFTHIGDTACLHLFVNPGNLDVLQIRHTSDTLFTTKRHQHRTMDGGEHHGATQWCADDCGGKR